MVTNRYYQPKPFVGKFYSPPLGKLEEVMGEAQQSFDRNFALTDEIRNQQLDVLDQDKARAADIQKEISDRVNQIVSKYNGDYSQATSDLRNYISELRPKYAPGGEIDTMTSNKKNFATWYDTEKKRLAEGKITGDQLNLAANAIRRNYTGAMADGKPNYLNPESLSEYTDGSKLVEEALKNVKPRKISTVTYKTNPDGSIVSYTDETEGVSTKEVNTAISNALVSDKKWLAYAKNMASLLGVDPTEYTLAQVDSHIKTYGPLHSGIFSDVHKEEYKGMDELTKMRLQFNYKLKEIGAREASQKRVAQFKHNLDNPGESSAGVPNLQRIATNKNASPFKALNLDELQTTSSGVTKKESTLELGSMFLLNPALGALNTLRKGSGKKTTFADLAKTGADGVDMSKVSFIQQNYPNATDYDKQKMYNEMMSQEYTGASVYMEPYHDPAQQRAAADQLIPRLAGTNPTVYEVNSKGELVPLSMSEAQENFWDKAVHGEKNRYSKAIAVGTTRTFTGDVPAGHVFDLDGKKYIVADTSPLLESYNGTSEKKGLRQRAFGWLSSGAMRGDVFEMYDENGKMIPAIGASRYEKTPSGQNIKRSGFYSVNPDGTPNFEDPWLNPDGTPMDMMDMERKLAGPQLDFLRQKQRLSKSQDNPESYYSDQERDDD